MGVVYRAEDVRLGRKVALKFLPESFSEDEEALDRFRLEARATSSLNHPNICTVYDIDEFRGQPFIAMELLEGDPLDRLVARGALERDALIEMAIDVAEGLDAAHTRGVIHRDIKPANIYLTRQKAAKILDFGLAKLAPGPRRTGVSDSEMPTQKISDRVLTSPGVTVGTVAYMSPEQARGLELDARTDLFAFGAALYEASTGRAAFPGNTPAVVFAAILNQDPIPPRQLNPELHPELERIVMKALEKDRDLRYQTAAEMRADLVRLKRDTARRISVASAEQIRLPTAKRSFLRRHWAAVALLAAALVLTGVYVLLQQRLADRLEGAAGSGRLTLLLSSPSPVQFARLSRDGKMIVYVAEQGGRADLFVSRIAGGGRVRVTSDDALESKPCFSPDGERIVFQRRLAGSEAHEICVIPSLGGEAVPIIPGGADPTWAPDGSRIAFVLERPGEAMTLATAAPNGTDVRFILDADAAYPFLRNPAWSPDGKRLAVVRSMGGMSAEIWLVSAEGGPPQRISSDAPGVFAADPVFSNDGKRIIHRSNRGGATNLWTISTDGGSLVQLTTGAGPDESPSLARDGLIAFINARGRDTLVVHDLDSGQSREVLSHSTYIWAPSFSPDGREIAYSRSETDGSWHIWIVPSEGGADRQLTFGTLPEIYPRFTPDGNFVVYSTWSTGPDRIWRIPRKGGPPTRLTPERDGDDEYCEVSPDGRRLAFARTVANETRIHVAEIGSEDSAPLTKGPSTVPRWSPDGKWIAFSRDRGYTGGVFVIRPDGLQERRVTESGGWPVWYPDSKRLAHRVVGPDGNQRVRVASLTGGPEREITGLEFFGSNYPIDVSRDGRWLTTSGWQHFSSEIWLLQSQP